MLNGHYDAEFEMLYIWTGEKEAVADTGAHGVDLAVFVATEDGHHPVGFEVMWGGAYYRLEEGYDPVQDTLTIGETTEDPALRTQNGDLVAHWRLDETDPDDFMDPIGVTVYGAKALMARVKVL